MKTCILLLLMVVLFITTKSQKIGIGTTSPTDQLHTTGTVRFQNYSGNGTRLLQMDSTGKVIVSGAGSITSNLIVYPVPSNGCAANNGLTSPLSVSGQPNPVSSSKISVRINITHPHDGELSIFLISPAGDVLSLAVSNGGLAPNFSNTVFSDAATTNISAGIAPFTGSFKPLGGTTACLLSPNVTTFGGMSSGSINPNGTWIIKVFSGGASIGSLNNWEISFSGPESFTTADQNNYVARFSSGNLVSSNIYQDVGTGNIGIGTFLPSASAALDINSSSKGFLPPRMDSVARNAILSPAQGLTIYNTSIKALQFYNGTGWYSAPAHFIGEVYGGGIVFYTYDSGQHGLISSTADQGAIRWYGGSNINTRARADGVGAGLKNTAIIIANQGPVDGAAFAATLCNEYAVTINGTTYADWYLPSKYELNLLYLQKLVVGGFGATGYWSSTEIDSGYAWDQGFTDGTQYNISKFSPVSVRGIRAF